MNDSSSIDPALASVSLRLAAIQGEKSLFDEFRKRFEAATTPADRVRYLTACGSFRDPKVIEEALDYLKKGPVRPNEIGRLVSGLGKSPAGRDRRYRYMVENYDHITSRLPAQMAIFMPYWASGCEADRLALAREFFSEPEHSRPGVDKNLARVADQIEECVSLREREGASVTEYLTRLTGGM
jgi:alanyl aminopeptidase